MNAVKAVEDIIRPMPNNIGSNTSLNDAHEKRTTLIKMAGTATGSGANATVAAPPQQTSTVRIS